MPEEFAVTYAQGRVDAFNRMEGSEGSWYDALAFADGYVTVMRYPGQHDDETVLALVCPPALLQFRFLGHPERATAFESGCRQVLACLKLEHHPRHLQAYVYGYAEGLQRFPPPDQGLHPAELLRTAAGLLGKQAG